MQVGAKAFGSTAAAGQAPAAANSQGSRPVKINDHPLEWDEGNLPASAHNKLADIDAAASEPDTIARSLAPEIDELRTEKFRLERIHQEWTDRDARYKAGVVVVPDGQTVDQLKSKIKAIADKLDRLVGRREQCFERSRPWKRDLDACTRYLRRAIKHGPLRLYEGPTPKLLKGETEPLRAWERCGRCAVGIEQNNRRIAASPIPSTAANAKSIATIDALAERGRPHVLGLIDHDEDVRFPEIGLRVDHPIDVAARVGSVAAPDTLGILAWLFPDAMKAALSREIDQRKNDEIALTADQRAAQLKQGAADLLATCRDEEHWFMAAIARGGNITRRPGCDPRAILGLVSDVEPEGD